MDFLDYYIFVVADLRWTCMAYHSAFKVALASFFIFISYRIVQAGGVCAPGPNGEATVAVINFSTGRFDCISTTTVGGGGGSGTIIQISSGTGISVINGTGPVVTISATGGGSSSSVTSAFGGLLTSSGSITQFNISTTPVKLAIFTSTKDFSNTVPSTASSQITVSTAGVYFLGLNIVSTGTGVYNFYYQIRVNGANTSLTGQDTPSVRGPAFGVMNLSSGDVVTAFGNTNTTTQSTITVQDAQLTVFTVGGSGGGGGGSGTITAVVAGSDLTGGGSSGSVTLALSNNSTNYIQNNRTGSPQDASIDVYSPGSQEFFVDSVGGVVYLNDTTGTGNTNLVYEHAGNSIANTGTNGLLGNYFIIVATQSGGNGVGRVQINSLDERNIFTGKSIFQPQAGVPFVTFDPVLNQSSFTRTVVFSSNVIDGIGSYGSSGKVLTSRGSGLSPTWQTSSGGSGIPGGADTNVQINQGGIFVGTATLTLNTTTNLLTAGTTSIFTGNVLIGTFTPSALNPGHQFQVNTASVNVLAAVLFASTIPTQPVLAIEDYNNADAIDVYQSGGGKVFSIGQAGNIANFGNSSASLNASQLSLSSAGGTVIVNNLNAAANSSIAIRSGAVGTGNVFIQAGAASVSVATFSVTGITLGSPLTISSTTIGTFFHECFGGQATLPGANSPFISNSTGETSAAVYFDDTSTQSVTCTFTVRNYDGRPLYADIIFHSTATSGTVNFGVYTATNTPNIAATNRDTPTFSTIVTTATVMISPAGNEMKATVALSNTTVLNGDTLTVKIEREAGSNDSAVGFARMTEAIIYE